MNARTKPLKGTPVASPLVEPDPAIAAALAAEAALAEWNASADHPKKEQMNLQCDTIDAVDQCGRVTPTTPAGAAMLIRSVLHYECEVEHEGAMYGLLKNLLPLLDNIDERPAVAAHDPFDAAMKSAMFDLENPIHDLVAMAGAAMDAFDSEFVEVPGDNGCTTVKVDLRKLRQIAFLVTKTWDMTRETRDQWNAAYNTAPRRGGAA